MAQAAATRTPAPRPQATGIFLVRTAVVALFALLMIGVRPVPIGGDTYWYVLDIQSSLGRGWTDSPHIWEFAHLLWRPLGHVLAQWFLPLVRPRFGGDVRVSIAFILMSVNLAAALACGLLLQHALWKLTGRPWLSLLGAAAFFGLGPVLSYSRAGTPYLCGLALSSLAAYLAASRPVTSWGRGLICGVLAGLAALLWVPYLFTIPAILLASPILNCFGEKLRERVRFAALVLVTAGVLMAVFYVVAIVCRHISTVADLHAWIAAEQKYGRSHTLLRLPGGFARGFYYMGDDSVWFKWYLFHDSYARVGIADLLGAMAFKLALFYGALASVVLVLWRSPMGQRLLLLAGVAALPHLLLAVSYESGDPGRYVPLLTFLLLPFGFALAGKELRVGVRVWLALLCFAPMAVNLATALASPTADGVRETALASAPGNSHFYVLNVRDDLVFVRYPSVFRAAVAPLAELEALDSPAPLPAGHFACATLADWREGRQIWITQRILAAGPARAWMWIEGDSPGVSWAALHRFFLEVEHAENLAGPDGFFRLSPTERNRDFLMRSLPAGGEGNCAKDATGVSGQP